VLATFYRYFLLITAIKITTVAVAFVHSTGDTVEHSGSPVAFLVTGGVGAVFALVGVGMLAYIEGLRLDAILYARWVNSIRRHFYGKKEASDCTDTVIA